MAHWSSISASAPGAKYSFGGWLSGTGRNQRIEGTHALLVNDKVARLALPADGAGAALLVLRARGFASGPLTVYVNNQVAAELKLNAKAFQLFSVPLRAGLLHAGDNILQLRVAHTGTALGLPEHRARARLDAAAAAAAPPPKIARHPALAELRDGAAPGARLRVPSGYALGFTLEVPAAAELRASVRAPAGAALGVWALRDGKQPLLLRELAAGRRGAALRIDLAPLAGGVARLELRARGGDVVLEQPAVVRLAEQRRRARRARKSPCATRSSCWSTRCAPTSSAHIVTESRVSTPGLNAFAQDRDGDGERALAGELDQAVGRDIAFVALALAAQRGERRRRAARSVELLPELLMKRGYYTGAFITNGYCSDKFGFKQGWRTYRNYIREGRPNTAKHVAADVLDWLDHRPKDQPFFLYVHTIDPHVPYKPPQQFLTFYDAQPYSGADRLHRERRRARAHQDRPHHARTTATANTCKRCTTPRSATTTCTSPR